MDYGQACRQTFIYRITEGLPVIRPESLDWPGIKPMMGLVQSGFERVSDWGSSIPHSLHITGILSATANGRDDRNLRSGGDRARESTCISDVFVRDENVDVFPHLSLLRCDAIPNARVECPESRQRLSQSCGRVFDLDFTASSRKFA